MRMTVLAVLSIAASAWGVPASADEGSVFVRGSLVYGSYKFDSAGFSDSGKAYGYGAGASLSKGPFLADLGLDYTKVSSTDIPPFSRTDLTLTGGYRVLDWLSLFGGLRRGLQGEDSTAPFSSDLWTESGYFFGAGFGPYELTPSLRLGGSLAYNLNSVELEANGFKFDYDGLSGKLRLGLSGTPHALELRYQKFDASDFDQTERYLVLAYVFNWKAGTF